MFFSLEVQSPLLLDTGMNDKKHVCGGDMEVQLGAALARAGSVQVQEVWLHLLQTAVFENHACGIAMEFLQRGGEKATKHKV